MGEASTVDDVPPRTGRRRRAACVVTVFAGVLVAATGFVLRGADRWPVEACTILYVGSDQKLHLTNERGTVDVQLPGPGAVGDVMAPYAPPDWSPSGRRIAYMHAVPGRGQYLVTLDPLDRRLWVYGLGDAGGFGGWLDDETVFDTAFGRRDAMTGEVRRDDPERQRLELYRPPSLRLVHDPFSPRRREMPRLTHVSTDPVTGGYVAAGDNAIYLCDRDLKQLGVISAPQAHAPRIDPTGDWVGWTFRHGASLWIAVESLSGATGTEEPRSLGHPYASAVFCGWTDDGNVLANVAPRPLRPTTPWRLVVLDKSGNLVREVPTDVPPLAKSAAAIRPRRPR